MKIIKIHMGPHLSGKSTHIHAIPGNNSIVINEPTLKETIKTLNKELKNPYNLFQIEFPFISKLAREQVYKALKRSGIEYEIYICFHHPPLEVLLERNKKKLIPYKEKLLKKQFYNLRFPDEISRDNIISYGYNEHPDVTLNSKPTLYHEVSRNHNNKGGDMNAILDDGSNSSKSVHSGNMGNGNNHSDIQHSKLDSMVSAKDKIDPYTRFLLRIRRNQGFGSRRTLFEWPEGEAKTKELIPWYIKSCIKSVVYLLAIGKKDLE